MKKIFIVAEIGNNHEGKFSNAIKLIKEAKQAGADAVKFQIYKTEKFIHPSDNIRFNRMKKFELDQEVFLKLKNFSKKIGINFFATPFDDMSLNFIIKNKISPIKIASGDNNNTILINKIFSKNQKCIISTGFLSENEIDKLILKLYRKFGFKKINSNLRLLHCVSSYPANKKNLNLNVIRRFIGKYKFPIGYSDHSLGIDACCLAASLGATIIEKHFTLDKNFSDFRDHKLSADPYDMLKMVRSIRDIELMMGNYKKKIVKDEKKILKSSRRSFYLNKNIKKGEIIDLKFINFLRPEKKNLITFKNYNKVINKKSKKKYKINQEIF